MNILFCLLAAFAQEPAAPVPAVPVAPPAEEAPARPWRTVDQIVVIVNQDIITEMELRRDLQRVRQQRKLTTDTEIRAAEAQILNEIVRKLLRVQAGAVLGIDEALIDARVADSLEQMRRRSGGVVALSSYLESRNVAGTEVRKLLRDDIYDAIYTDGQTGAAPGPLGRITVDQYVRPGLLGLLFQQSIERPAEMVELGGSVGLVKFQQIVIDVDQVGGPDAARKLALDLTARIQAGEDMGALARKHGGAREDDGIAEVEEARLRELFAEIATFTAQASPGQISEPLESTTRGTSVVRIVRFIERKPAVVPDFANAQIQDKLRKRAKERLEIYRLESGYAALLAGSYVWPPELAGRAAR